MFNCKKCGKVKAGEKEFRIPSMIRNVKYLLEVKLESRYEEDGVEPKFKRIGEKMGWEIVQEDKYCAKCVPKEGDPVNILEEMVERTMLVKRKKRKNFKKGNDDGKSRDDNQRIQ